MGPIMKCTLDLCFLYISSLFPAFLPSHFKGLSPSLTENLRLRSSLCQLHNGTHRLNLPRDKDEFVAHLQSSMNCHDLANRPPCLYQSRKLFFPLGSFLPQGRHSTNTTDSTPTPPHSSQPPPPRTPRGQKKTHLPVTMRDAVGGAPGRGASPAARVGAGG